MSEYDAAKAAAATGIEAEKILYHSKDVEAVTADELKNAKQFLHDAQLGAETERKMTLVQALRTYPRAALWSFLISLAVIMEGYDGYLIGQFYAYPAWQIKFGEMVNGVPTVPAVTQQRLLSTLNCGQLTGLILSGFVTERYGYRIVMSGGLIALTGFIFLFFFAQNLNMIIAAYALCGIPWGIFQVITVSYAAEVVPTALRAYLTSWVNCCWGIGFLIAAGILRALVTTRNDDWGWRIPYAVQWVWPLPLLLIITFAPESPWWLVRKGRFDDARKSLRRLASGDSTEESIDQTVAMMSHTIREEALLTAGTSYRDLFRGSNLRRTECAVLVQACTLPSGLTMVKTYGTVFFTQAGLPTGQAFSLSLGQQCIQIAGTLLSWGLMTYGIGRRTLFIAGTGMLCALLLVVGGLGVVNTPQASLGGAIILLGWNLIEQCCLGAVGYSLAAELPSRRLMVKSLNLGRACYMGISFFTNNVTPLMLSATSWNWGAKTAFFYAGGAGLTCVWAYLRLPEPRGLTYGQIDALFEKGTNARHFQQATVDEFEAERNKLEIVEQQGNRPQQDLKAEMTHIEQAPRS